MLYHTSPNGVVGLVLANGALSTIAGGEDIIREAIVKADLVEVIVALPSRLFSNTQIPACIWILNKNKAQKGKTLFITGATRGIGYAIAEKAAKDGANIAIIAKTTEPHPKLPGTIHTAAEDLIKAGGNAIGIKTDIRFEDQVLAAVDKTVETFGGIDICINNASAISLTPTLNTDMKKYDLMHNINTRGTFMVSKSCIPHLKKEITLIY